MAVEITPGKSEEELKCLFALEGEQLRYPINVAVDGRYNHTCRNWEEFMAWYRTFQ